METGGHRRPNAKLIRIGPLVSPWRDASGGFHSYHVIFAVLPQARNYRWPRARVTRSRVLMAITSGSYALVKSSRRIPPRRRGAEVAQMRRPSNEDDLQRDPLWASDDALLVQLCVRQFNVQSLSVERSLIKTLSPTIAGCDHVSPSATV